MVTLKQISNSRDLVRLHLTKYTNVEINAYNEGSYLVNVKYRKGLEFLELYYLIIDHTYDILNNGYDLSDFGLIDSDIQDVLNNTYELLFYYGIFFLSNWILRNGIWDDLGMWIDDEIWID